MKYKPNGYQALKNNHSNYIRMCRLRSNAVFTLRRNMTRHVYLLTFKKRSLQCFPDNIFVRRQCYNQMNHIITRSTPKILSIIDMKLIDRSVHLIATYSVHFAGWLWRIIDIRVIDHKVGQVAGRFYATGQLLQKMELRTTQHQLFVMIFWLGAMTGLFYILV